MVRKRKTVSKRVCNRVDRISELSDDLLIKVLSFLPTKVAASTTVLSKRWDRFWMWLPKLEFECYHHSLKDRRHYFRVKNFSSFLVRSLPLYRAPVIESLHFGLSCDYIKPEDIKLSIVIALSRYLRKLKIRFEARSESESEEEEPYDILPSSLFNCKSLVTLKLRGEILLDVPRMVCLPSLKTLELDIYKSLDGRSLQRRISICPALEDLTVQCDSDYLYMGFLTVVVPSLQRLTLHIPVAIYGLLVEQLMINTPSLKYLRLEDFSTNGYPFSIANMPNLEDACVAVRYPDISSHIGSITSVKRLKICSETVYSDGFVFNQLEKLKLCVCSENSSSLLVRLLEDSPNLRVLKIYKMDHGHWKVSPYAIDECVLATLEAFDW